MDGDGFDIDLSGAADELPPGVQPGSLGGTDEAPEAATPVEETPLAVDLDEEFEAALAGDDDGDWQPEEVDVDDEPFATAEPSPEVGAAIRADAVFEEDVLAAEAAEELGDEEAADQGMETPPDAETGDDARADVATAEPPEPEPQPPAPAPAPPKPKAKPKAKAKAKPAKSRPKPKPASSSNGVSGTIARRYFIFEKTQADINGQIVEVFARVQFSDPDTSEVIEGITARNRTLALNKAGKLFGHGYEGTLIATPESMWEEKTVRNKPREEFRVEIS